MDSSHSQTNMSLIKWVLLKSKRKQLNYVSATHCKQTITHIWKSDSQSHTNII